jgi:hypothetical protein
MKLDPGMHIVMHLVFFGKTGVTPAPRQPRAMPRSLPKAPYLPPPNPPPALLSLVPALARRLCGHLHQLPGQARHQPDKLHWANRAVRHDKKPMGLCSA